MGSLLIRHFKSYFSEDSCKDFSLYSSLQSINGQAPSQIFQSFLIRVFDLK